MTIKEIFREYIGCIPNERQCIVLKERYGTEEAFNNFVVGNIMRGNDKAIDRMLDSIEDIE